MRIMMATLLFIGLTGLSSQASAGDAAIDSALTNPGRLEGDSEADGRRKPAEVLEFFGIKPGMRVLEMFAGSGYYTELMSYVVGEEGSVVAQNNAAYLRYSKDALEKRFTPGRLANVERLTAENNELELAQNSFDAAVFVLAYHDVYYIDEPNGWPRIDGPAMLAEIHRSLKPGAVVGVVDHVAPAGSPADSGDTLHRIDPALLRKDFEAAGFVFEAQSDMLRNPQDDYAKPMFDPTVRGKTDRFVYRFRRP
ncbi:MAG: class I SAM-dependent methyltransferase [Gammaproteobacteria bacterium]|nr:MAG: class I SAM-dependent methyltransferase [Gammaproteobacteria bacterium]